MPPPSISITPREHLLNTAVSLFSVGGFDGVSVNDIVAAAGVSKRMVYHYFKSKALLYQEALFFAFSALAKAEKTAVSAACSLEDAVKKLVHVYFDFPRAHPQFSRLLRWENLNEGRGIKDSHFPLSKDHVVKFLRTAIKQEADSKQWCPDLEPKQLLISIIGICQVYVSHRYTLSQGLHFNLGSPAAIKRGMANAEHFILAGMRAK